MSYIGVAALLLASIGANEQRKTANHQEDLQARADALQERVEAVKARNAAARNIQEARIRGAQAAAEGQASGAASSAVQGIQGSLTTQAASNVGAINSSLAASAKLTDINSSMNKATNRQNNINAAIGVVQAGTSAFAAAKAPTSTPSLEQAQANAPWATP